MKICLALLSVLLGTLCIFPAHANASEEQDLGWALFHMPICEKHIEGFAIKAKKPYKRMRLRHAKFIEAYEANREAYKSAQPDGSMQGQALEQLQSGCEVTLDFMLSDGQPPDPRLTTPTQTWELFMSALGSGNKKTLAACFNPADRPKYMQQLGELSAAELANIAKSLKNFNIASPPKDIFQEATVESSEGNTGVVLFVKSYAGWRISQL